MEKAERSPLSTKALSLYLQRAALLFQPVNLGCGPVTGLGRSQDGNIMTSRMGAGPSQYSKLQPRVLKGLVEDYTTCGKEQVKPQVSHLKSWVTSYTLQPKSGGIFQFIQND